VPQELLALMPAADCVRLFRGERGEKQLRIARCPREGFGFVQREVEDVLIPVEMIGKFAHDLFADVFDLGQKFTAGGDATDAEIHLRFTFSVFNFSHHNIYSSSSCLFSQI